MKKLKYSSIQVFKSKWLPTNNVKARDPVGSKKFQKNTRSDMKIFKYSSIQVFKFSSIQVFKCSSIQVFKYSSIQVFKSKWLVTY